MFKHIYANATVFKWALSYWMPLWGTGITVRSVSPDFHRIVVQMKARWYNRNAFGVHFGGSLYAMVDPFYCLMLVAILGKDYVVWDKDAQIDFIKPGTGMVHAVFEWTPQQVADIKLAVAGGNKHLPVRVVDIVNEAGELVAQVHKTLYVRKKRGV